MCALGWDHFCPVQRAFAIAWIVLVAFTCSFFPERLCAPWFWDHGCLSSRKWPSGEPVFHQNGNLYLGIHITRHGKCRRLLTFMSLQTRMPFSSSVAEVIQLAFPPENEASCHPIYWVILLSLSWIEHCSSTCKGSHVCCIYLIGFNLIFFNQWLNLPKHKNCNLSGPGAILQSFMKLVLLFSCLSTVSC